MQRRPPSPTPRPPVTAGGGRTGRALLAGVSVAAVVAGATAGCARVTVRREVIGPVQTVTSTSHSPGPVHTIVLSGPTLRAGRAFVLRAQAGVVLRIGVGAPTTSTTRLSPSYGYPPQHGHYVSFRVTVADLGQSSVAVSPLYFYVRIARQGKVTVNDGNAPYSGASAQLDNTQLDPGQTDKGPLTFDVERPHGKLVFAPDGTAAVTWLF